MAKDGTFNPIPSTPYSPGSTADMSGGGETYLGHNDGPSSNDIKPIGSSSTNPGQTAGGGGEYNPVGHDGSPTFSDSHGQSHPSKAVDTEWSGYKVLSTVDVFDRCLPNENHAPGMTDWNHQDSYYFEGKEDGPPINTDDEAE